jgi:hypothetical protein
MIARVHAIKEQHIVHLREIFRRMKNLAHQLAMVYVNVGSIKLFQVKVANWGQAFDSGDSPIEKLGVTISSVKSKNRRPDPGLDPLIFCQ